MTLPPLHLPLHFISSPCISTSNPICFKPSICMSIGLLPILQPPGLVMVASPHLARRLPMRKTEERILLIISCGTRVLHILRVSATRQLSLNWVSAPSDCRISSITNTSSMQGQSCISCIPGLATAAAKTGRAEFLAPFMRYSPASGTPPCI